MHSPSIKETSQVGAVQEFQAIDVWSLLRRRRTMLVIGAVLGATIAATYLSKAPAVYQSTAQVLVVRKDTKLAPNTIDGQFGFESSLGEELLATHMQIVSSPRIAKNAIGNRRLLELDSLSTAIEGEEVQTPENAAVAYILSNLRVRRGGEGRAKQAQVLGITFEHSSPVDCEIILAAIIESYQEFLRQTVHGAGNEAAKLISKASSELEERVKHLDEQYSAFREQAPMLWKRDGTIVNPHEIRLVELQSELSKLRFRRTEVRSRLAVVEKALENGQDRLVDLAMIDTADIGRLALLLQAEQGQPLSEAFQAAQPLRVETASAEFDRLLALKVETARKKLELGENHPSIVGAEKEIKELEDFLRSHSGDAFRAHSQGNVSFDRLANAYHALLTRDLEDFDRREKSLLELSDDEQAKAKQLIALEAKQDSLRRARERAQLLYDSVVQRLNEINLVKDYGGFITEVIAPVRLGDRAGPNGPLVLGLGTILGLFGAMGLAIWTEVSDETFRGPSDVAATLGLPVLTHVPKLTGARKEKKRPASLPANVLATLHRPQSGAADAIRSLRAAVYCAANEQGVIQITSPQRGNGTSTLAANLAVSMAQTRKEVLLIDCNLRRPSIHDLFAVNAERGISTLLSGEHQLDEVILDTSVPGLKLLPCGPPPIDPSELISLPEFSQVLREVAHEYDYVLIDSPPICVPSDPLTIASQADFVLLNLQLSKHSRASALRAVQQLTGYGAKMLGVVVNQPSCAGRTYTFESDEAYGDTRENVSSGNGVLPRAVERKKTRAGLREIVPSQRMT